MTDAAVQAVVGAGGEKAGVQRSGVVKRLGLTGAAGKYGKGSQE
jgi:hypothetical protein